MRFLAILIVIGFLGGVGKMAIERHNASMPDGTVIKSVETFNQKLPMTVGNAIRIEKLAYADRVIHISGTLLGRFAMITDEANTTFTRLMTEEYCRGAMKGFAKAKIAVVYQYSTVPHTLDLKVQTWSLRLSSDRCA